VDDHDPMAFATAIAAILDYPSFAERLSDGAVAFSEKFSWEATATRLLELYGGITDPRSQKPEARLEIAEG
ncbi:MAG: D-inositol-3-phosphate glycosyltransferase, partial [Acidimicrobiia bacterium]